MFLEIAKNKENYNQFYATLSKNLKLGIHEVSQNKTKFTELLKYHPTESGDVMTSLKVYVTSIHEVPNDIYYITGESMNLVANFPISILC